MLRPYFYAMRPYKNVLPLFFVCALLLNTAGAQQLIELKSGTTAHIRGLSVVNDRVVWASGTKGQVGLSTDGGKTWNWRQIPGFEQIDFRDIEAFDEYTALVMGVGSPGFVLRTTDSGKNWTIVYKNEDPRNFLDALFFWNDRSGMIIGDPIDGRFFILRSFDGGKSWRAIPPNYRPIAFAGEACFAASGSNISAVRGDEAIFVSGGTRSRVFIQDTSFVLPLTQGRETTGANAVAAYQKNRSARARRIVVVGGDFSADKNDVGVCAISQDGGNHWKLPNRGPFGYRSAVAWIDRSRLIACGTSGVDISENGGMDWRSLSTDGYHVCTRSPKGRTVFLAGASGRIAKLIW